MNCVFCAAQIVIAACRPRLLILSAFGVLVVSALFYMLVGHEETSSWPGNAVHNWNEYGFRALHGKLVTNPGGFEALTKPVIYLGHRAASYYEVFAVGKLLGWAGDGLLMFHLVFSLALFFSVWFLLGRSQLAAAGAAATALCPGYTIYPTVLDPNAVALYMALPYAAIMIYVLSGKIISPLQLVFLALLTFGYTSLNWSTAFGHGILFCTLLVIPALPWTRLAIYVGLAALSVGVVACQSVLDKINVGPGAAGGSNFKEFLSGYTWGHNGYGIHVTTAKAIVRLSAANAMGLLPLLGFSAWLAVKFRPANRSVDLLAFLPLLAAVLGIMTMRNYFGHHPWMAAPMLIPGLVLSLAALLKRNPAENAGGQKKFFAGLFLAGSLVYALLILGAHRVYHAESLELTALVLQHTQRNDTIVLVQNLDPQMAEQTDALAESCDRRIVVLPDLNAPRPAGENLLLLSAAPLAQLPLVAHSEKSALRALPLVQPLSTWYAQKISKRNAQDQHFEYTVGTIFGLYRLPAGR